MSRRRWVPSVFSAARAAGAIGAAVTLLLLAGCGPSSRGEGPVREETSPRPKSDSATAAAASVVYLSGEVAIDGVPAQTGAVVPSDATVTTGADGLCEIVFSGRNILQIGPGSVAVLNFAEFGRGIQLESGSLAAVLRELQPTPSGSRFQVDTPTAVAGVRGTAFFVRVVDLDATYFCLCNGTMSLQDNRGRSPTDLEAAHHRSVTCVRGNGSVTIEQAPMLHHTDLQMEELARKIGNSIDWGTAYHPS